MTPTTRTTPSGAAALSPRSPLCAAFLLALVWAALALAPPPLRASQVQVAVASNFAATLQALAAEFQKTTPHTLQMTVGATGKLFGQIEQGAPFDVFLAADAETPARLLADGFAVENTRFTYAIGRLVLWSAEPGLVDPQAAVLGSNTSSKLAFADPRHSPYGAAAMQTLARRGLAARWQGRILQSESAAQAHQSIVSKEAALGLIPLSLVMRNGKVEGGSHWIVPGTFHTPLRQVGILLKKGANNDGAKAFLKFLASDAARVVMRSYGYDQ